MFGSKSEGSGVAGFADQFEPVGKNFVYRRNLRGPPIPVSARERDRFVETFDTIQYLAKCGLVGGVLILAFLAIFLPVEFNTQLPDWVVYGGVVLLAALFFAAFNWAWLAPDRALRGRTAVGAPLTPGELRSRFLAKISYGQLALMGMVTFISLIWGNGGKDLLSGWNLLLLAVAIIPAAIIALRAFRNRHF